MDLSEYILEPLRKHEDFTLYRGWHRSPDQSERSSILLMAPLFPHPTSSGVRQVEHIYSLGPELGRASYVCRTGIAQYHWWPVLVLENDGGELLDALVQKPINTGYFLRIALEKALEEITRSDDRPEGKNRVLGERVDPQPQLLSEQKRVASELDWRVAERTRELVETNEDLQIQAGLLQHLPVSAWTLKPDGTPDFVNHIWLEFAGQTLDFVRSHPEAWMTAVHPEDRERASRAFWDGVRSGQGFRFEIRSLRAQDGVYRWHLQQAVVLRDAEGKVLKFVGAITDIDDQKRAEEALRASEANLRRVIDNIPGLVSTLGPDGETKLINGQMLEYFGKTPEELKNWRLDDAIHPDDLPRIIALHLQSIKPGVSFGGEYRLRHFDGIYRWFQFRAEVVRDASGGVNGWYVLATDIHDRKQAEDALQASERNFASIINTIPTLAWSARPDGYCDFLSQGWLDFTGLPLDRAQGWGWSDAIHPEDRDKLVQDWQSAIATGMLVDTEARLCRFDGVYRWTLIRANPWRNESGSIVKWYGTNTDIDDRKRAEEALRASEANLRRVIDTIRTLSWCNLADGPNEFLSKSWHDYTGLSPEEARGWGWSVAFHRDDLPPLLKRWQELLVSGEPGEIEARLRRHDGVYRWFLIRVAPFRDESGRILRWYGTSTDIHDRKLADEALRASESNFRQIVDSIPGLVCTMDASGEIEQLNRPLLDYFGKTPGELKDWRMTDAVHPDDLPEVIKAYTHSIATGEPYSIEHRCLRADGVYRWFQVRALAVHGTDTKICGWYVLLTDIEDRKQAEDELKRSEARYRVVIETASDAVVSTDESGEITLANPAIKRMFGYNPEELIGKSLKVLMPGAMHKLFETGFKRFLETGARNLNWQGTEVTAVRANGEEFPVEVSFGEITANGRKIFTGFIRDISEKKRAEQAVLASQRNLRLAVDTMPVLSWSALRDGTADFFNKRWLDYTGLSLDKAQGQGWAQAFHPDDLDRVNDYWRSHVVSGEPGEIEARLRRFDGSYRWFLLRANPLRDELGAVVKWYGTNTDIDDRKRAEEELRLREVNLRQITETIPEMLWSAGPDGMIDYCNGRLLNYAGISSEAVMGTGWTKILHPDDVESWIRSWKASVETGCPFRQEVRTFHGADQIYRWCVTSALPLHDEDGNIVKWHGTVVDMHDWKQAEEELRDTQAELAKMTRITTMGELTASIAHEVNQPLSGIMTNANTCLRMLNASRPNIEGARETARRIIRDGNRASDVIARLRSLFNRKEVVAETVDLNEATREVIALMLSELQKSSVIVTHEYADHLPTLKGDRIQLQQVILNLVRNASDAMAGVENRPRRLIFQTEQAGDYVTLTVRDSGIGFDPAIADQMFESFYTTKPDGMGIGLSVCRSIIEAHHGRLWATANQGHGATFAFAIPWKQSGPYEGNSAGKEGCGSAEIPNTKVQ